MTGSSPVFDELKCLGSMSDDGGVGSGVAAGTRGGAPESLGDGWLLGTAAALN